MNNSVSAHPGRNRKTKVSSPPFGTMRDRWSSRAPIDGHLIVLGGGGNCAPGPGRKEITATTGLAGVLKMESFMCFGFIT